jgi:predicted DNA-binding transcriptional regulator YafY
LAQRNGEYPNCSRIVKEFGVERKTAWLDIEWMKDRKALPIDYDDLRHGYYLTGPIPDIPTMAVTEKEMFELYVMHQAIQHYRGTPIGQRLEAFFKRLSLQLDNSERFMLEDMGSVLSFRPFAPDEADPKLFELLTRATRQCRVLSFDYRKPGEKKPEPRRVRPYSVHQNLDRWYLFGWDLARRDIRKFVLGRMRAPNLTNERFQRPKNFDPRDYCRTSIGVMTGKGDYQIVIEMDPWLTDILRGRRFHPSQIVDELPNGGSHLTLRLSALEEIEQYVLSWGSHATVIQPQELRDRVTRTACSLVRQYS